MVCEICFTWMRQECGRLVTEHHENCPQYDLEGDAKKIVEQLIAGINAWAADEDGIHPECWDAYQRARAFIGLAPTSPE